MNAAGQIVGATVNTTGHIIGETVNVTGQIVGGTVHAVGSIAGGSRARKKRVSIPPQVQILVQRILNGESISPFAAWGDFIEWLDTSSDCAEYSSSLINQNIIAMSDEKPVAEGIQYLALCLNTKKIPDKGISMVLKLTVAEYEKKLLQLSTVDRETELIAIMLYFSKLCELCGIQ